MARAPKRNLTSALSASAGTVWTLLLSVTPGAAQRPTTEPTAVHSPHPKRLVHRDVPLTAAIRRAFAAGTRDSTGRPGRRYWQLWTDYTIHARLEPTTATLTGRETVVVHNPTLTALPDLVLRLDQNICRPEAVRLKSVCSPTEGMTITRLAVDGRTVDLANVTGLTSTVARIKLPAPVPAQGSVTLDAEWRFQVPTEGFRMGRAGDSLYQIAQWYPRVAVYDDLNGWHTEPYLGLAEFYNNYGRFDVTLDVPVGWLIGATGVLQNPERVLTPGARARLARVLTSDSVRTIVRADERGPGQATVGGERRQWRFVADTASDVAWTTSDRYVWDATRATIPGRGSIPVHLFYTPDQAVRYGRSLVDMRRTLEFLSAFAMPYAFPQLTMAQWPATSMEYPMFIMSSSGTAEHEAGHQWFPMMVGSNETWYGWMDEGFTTYLPDDPRPPDLYAAMKRARAAYQSQEPGETEPPLLGNSNRIVPGADKTSWGMTYYRAPRMFAMLAGVVGYDAVDRAMSAYARAWRFKHPSPWDFMFFMNNVLKQDLGWLWYYWLFTNEELVDGSIEAVTTAGPRTTVTVQQAGEIPAPVVLEVTFAPAGPALKVPTNATLRDSVTAIVRYPVDVWFDGRRTFEAVLDFGDRAGSGRAVSGPRSDGQRVAANAAVRAGAITACRSQFGSA
jgi:hypothetical protein